MSQLRLLPVSALAVMSSSLTLIRGGPHSTPGWTWGSSQKKRFALDAEGGDRRGELEGCLKGTEGGPFLLSSLSCLRDDLMQPQKVKGVTLTQVSCQS